MSGACKGCPRPTRRMKEMSDVLFKTVVVTTDDECPINVYFKTAVNYGDAIAISEWVRIHADEMKATVAVVKENNVLLDCYDGATDAFIMKTVPIAEIIGGNN